MQPSPKYSLNYNDVRSVLITLLIVSASAMVAQLLSIIPNTNFGAHTDIIVICLVTVLKVVQKYLEGEPKQ